MTRSQLRIIAVRCLAAIVLLVWAGLTAAPAAAEGKVTVTGPEKSATVEIDKDSKRAGHMRGRLHLVVSASKVPSGGAPLTVGAYLDADGDASDTCTKPEAVHATLAEPLTLQSNVATAAVVDLTLDKKCADRDGTLAFSTPGNTPATLRFTLTRGVEDTPEYGNALAGATVAVFAVFALMILTGNVFGPVRANWAIVRLPIEAPFSVKDSWLTTVASIGAVLGTVLGASSVITEWLPGISIAQFVGLNVTFGALILFAPVIYAASCSWGMKPLAPVPPRKPVKASAQSEVVERVESAGPDVATPADPVERQFKAAGHGWGLVASACTTLAGVFGQLATLLVMVVSADGTKLAKWVLGVCVCTAACFVALYAVRFVRGALGAGCAASAAAQPPTRVTTKTFSTAAL
ncbi:hypothetical protein ACF05L_39230 [Streptomyces bobili]|uniref:hypothetical protein n=1 Tax=Streptomyces bobili TaxID=67280 RepID=UPI0037000307